ncbi:MAG: BON domain-containing protein [Proteobacteria bacterium]|nr:BON domain-containing protein [Pseudomonadota bacterium]
MKRCIASLVLGLLLAQLCACTAYEAYRKCGFAGCPGDREIATQIEARCAGRRGSASGTSQVQSLDHVVYLYGLVDTDPERVRVEEVASRASGGLKIVDSIAVRASIIR